MSDILGYVVVEWNQASGRPDLDHGTLHDDLEWARKMADLGTAAARKRGRGERYSVHAVMAEEIEEGS